MLSYVFLFKSVEGTYLAFHRLRQRVQKSREKCCSKLHSRTPYKIYSRAVWNGSLFSIQKTSSMFISLASPLYYIRCLISRVLYPTEQIRFTLNEVRRKEFYLNLLNSSTMLVRTKHFNTVRHLKLIFTIFKW